MIQRLSIKNFRCFEQLNVDGLANINVIVGANASGKTSLLESIFLAAGGTPEIVLRLALWRGLGHAFPMSLHRGSYESIWRDLFFRFEQERAILISLSGEPESSRTLRISYSPSGVLAIPPAANEKSAATVDQKMDSSAIVPIIFEWADATGQKREFQVKITSEGLTLGALPIPALTAFFSSSFTAVSSPSEPASQFSELNKRKHGDQIRQALRSAFPSIADISIEVSRGAYMLHCEVPWIPEKVPLALISTGIQKLIAILLGISSQPKGVVLVDELENGFYYKILPDVWRSLLRFCEIFGVQVFASTHSRECLRAALPTIAANEGKFRLIRMEREKNECIPRIFDGHEFAMAIQQEVEFR